MAHAFVNPLTHLIFSTKNREPLIVLDLKFDPLPCMGGIVRELRGKTVAYRFRGNSSASSIRTVFDTASGTFRNDVLRPSGAMRRQGGTFSHGLRHGLNSSAPSGAASGVAQSAAFAVCGSFLHPIYNRRRQQRRDTAWKEEPRASRAEARATNSLLL